MDKEIYKILNRKRWVDFFKYNMIVVFIIISLLSVALLTIYKYVDFKLSIPKPVKIEDNNKLKDFDGKDAIISLKNVALVGKDYRDYIAYDVEKEKYFKIDSKLENFNEFSYNYEQNLEIMKEKRKPLEDIQNFEDAEYVFIADDVAFLDKDEYITGLPNITANVRNEDIYLHELLRTKILYEYLDNNNIDPESLSVQQVEDIYYSITEDFFENNREDEYTDSINLTEASRVFINKYLKVSLFPVYLFLGFLILIYIFIMPRNFKAEKYAKEVKEKIENENLNVEDILNDIHNSNKFNALILGRKYIFIFERKFVYMLHIDEILWCYVANRRTYSSNSGSRTITRVCIIDKTGNYYDVYANYFYDRIIDEIEIRNSDILLGYDRNLEIKVDRNIEEVHLFDKSTLDKRKQKYL